MKPILSLLIYRVSLNVPVEEQEVFVGVPTLLLKATPRHSEKTSGVHGA